MGQNIFHVNNLRFIVDADNETVRMAIIYLTHQDLKNLYRDRVSGILEYADVS
jgi:hypothetical protein